MLCATVLGGEAGAKGTRSLWYVGATYQQIYLH